MKGRPHQGDREVIPKQITAAIMIFPICPKGGGFLIEVICRSHHFKLFIIGGGRGVRKCSI